MQIREVFDRKRFVFLDGGMGTQLQARGLQPGQKPELAALEMPEVLTAIHTDYANAGADILLANTFGANAKKLTGCGHTVEEVVSASIACARKAAETTGACVALDIGPLGELLVPAGTLAFEDAYNEFAQVIRAGAAAGADLVFLETMTDLYELKAAILAARENCDLPVFTSMSFESRGRTFTGCTVESYAVTAAGLGADAVGINCSLGPKEILPFAQRLCRSVPAGVPVFVKPNAGLPNPDGSYNLDPDEFAAEMKEYAAIGVSMVGGCCGTTPAFIARLHETFSPLTPADKIPIRRSCLCTPVRFVEVDGITVVGERINPTGKKRLQQALRDGDSAYPCTQAVAQAEAGAQVLDVNAGLPGIDEAATLEQLVKDLQAVTDLPLQLDSSNPEALSRALRIYNGKPIVNSVNGEPETLEKILPLCKKYGAAVVGLALDKGGIPPTAEGRFAIAQRIVAAANAAGIPNEDIYIDCLTLTASAQQEGAVQTLEALSRCKRELGVRTVLGVSNISFGLPCRGYLNTTFLTMAMSAGLDLAIMNPNTPEMMAAVRAYRVLTSQDLQSTDYVAAYADVQIQTTQTSKSAATVAEVGAAAPGGDALFEAVRRGLKAEARAAADAALTMREPLDVVNVSLIPALDAVGDGFEKGTVFLPQLLQAATAAQAAFEAIKAKIAASGQAQGSKGKIVIATVKGDVHDIGKNIVRVILENYGYDVLDLGRDVDPERVVEAVRQTGAKLVGLSALMTTTVPNMQATIEALHTAHLDCKVMVGGAVLTPDYARDIGADYYCKDAKASADLAKQLLG
jgi:5-methyltetrahydrofolate--homocysteine methyltransferase